MYKNNSRDSSKFKGCSPLKLSCNLTVKFYTVGYYSYTNRYNNRNCICSPILVFAQSFLVLAQA
jgi:hypothetical protein